MYVLTLDIIEISSGEDGVEELSQEEADAVGSESHVCEIERFEDGVVVTIEDDESDGSDTDDASDSEEQDEEGVEGDNSPGGHSWAEDDDLIGGGYERLRRKGAKLK